MSQTANVKAEKPNRGDFLWWSKWNDNADLFDSAIGNLNSTIGDLPQLYRLTDTFNGPTGVAITLPRSVDAVNEYSVKVTPTSRAAAIGDIWIDKALSQFTVYCSQTNTSDTFEVTLYYLGDVSSYGGSMYRRYYVSPSTAISDHSNSSEAGSLAYMIAAIGSMPAILELPGNKTYTLTANDVTIPSTLAVLPQPGAVINVGSGRTLTFSGPIVAGRWKVFMGDGNVVFNPSSVAVAYPQWFGAVGDGATDDADPINATADACRAAVIPIDFGPGNFYVMDSLNFTGANFDLGLQAIGWKISGAGSGVTMITGNLSSGYPIVDMSDNHRSRLSDLRIQGHSSGSQICGLLHAMVGSTQATENMVSNVLIAGTYTQAGYINVSADLAIARDSSILGPCGAIFTADKDALGAGVIQSLYQTITSTPNMTVCRVSNCTIEGDGGDSANWDAAIVLDEMGKLSIVQTYIAQGTNAKCGIMVAGSTGAFYDYHQIDFISSRYENQGSNDSVFLWKETGQTLGNCNFIGDASAGPGSGSMFYLDGDGRLDSSIIKLSADPSDWDHFVSRAGTGEITNCQIYEQTVAGSLLDGIDAAILGDGNIVHLLNWNANWLNAGGNTIFITPEGRYDACLRTGYNTIAATGQLARKFGGHIRTDWLLSYNDGPSGSDITEYTYTLPGDIFAANTVQNAGMLRIVAWGHTEGNSNFKTIKAKFGILGSETTVAQNDITSTPNSLGWRIEIDLLRLSTVSDWEYSATMIVGNTKQSVKMGYISADPDASTVDFLLTVNAAASDVLLRAVYIDLL